MGPADPDQVTRRPGRQNRVQDPRKGRPVLVVGSGNPPCKQAIVLVEPGSQALLTALHCLGGALLRNDDPAAPTARRAKERVDRLGGHWPGEQEALGAMAA